MFKTRENIVGDSETEKTVQLTGPGRSTYNPTSEAKTELESSSEQMKASEQLLLLLDSFRARGRPALFCTGIC